MTGHKIQNHINKYVLSIQLKNFPADIMNTLCICEQGGKCVKIVNINYNWSITLCDNCNQSIFLCSPDEVSIKSQTGPMQVFHAFTEGYIN